MADPVKSPDQRVELPDPVSSIYRPGKICLRRSCTRCPQRLEYYFWVLLISVKVRRLIKRVLGGRTLEERENSGR